MTAEDGAGGDEGSPTAEWHVADPVDLRATLAAAGIDHVEVTDERTIVVYGRSVLNVVVTEGTLSGTRALAVEMVDAPRDPGVPPAELLQRFLDEVEAASEGASSSRAVRGDRR